VTDLSTKREPTGPPPVVSEDVLKRVARRVVTDSQASDGLEYTFDTRLTDLAFDSIVLAELIVELEHELGTMLDITAPGRLDTLGDLCRALRPVRADPPDTG
jgi:acyl carrier protein